MFRRLSVCVVLCVLVCITVTTLVSAQEDTPLGYPCDAYGCEGSPENCPTSGKNCEACSDDQHVGPQCLLIDGDATCTCNDTHTVQVDGASACSANSTCICEAGWATSDCSLPRITLECTDDTMSVTIRSYSPHGDDSYEGQIFLSTVQDVDFEGTDDECTAPNGEEVTFSLSSDSGTTCAPAGDGSEGLTVYAYIQHKEDYHLVGDDLYRLFCRTGQGPGAHDIYTDVISVAQPSLGDRDPALSTYDQVGSFTMLLRGGDGTDDLPDTITVGTDMSLIMQHPLVFSVKSITGYNYDPAGDAPAEAKSVDIVIDWCAQPGALGLIRSAVVYADGDVAEEQGGVEGQHLIRVPINAWYFTGPLRNTYIQAVGCIGSDGECAPSDAGTGGIPVCENTLMDAANAAAYGTTGETDRRRKRRQADTRTSTNTTAALEVYITVHSHGSRGPVEVHVDDGGTADAHEDTSYCYTKLSVLLPVILLAGLLLVTMAMAFFFCVKLTFKREEHSTAGSIAFKKS